MYDLLDKKFWIYTPLKNLYQLEDEITTDTYELKTQKFRYPKDTMEMMRGGIIPGDYTVLYSKERHCVVMSDTPMEQYTNQSVIKNAHGNVLILGLGIGMIITALYESQSERIWDYDIPDEQIIKSITVVEKDKKLIELMKPILENYLKNFNEDSMDGHTIDFKIIEADAYEYPKTCKEHYDYMYADIWDEYRGFADELRVFEQLQDLYKDIADEFDGWGYADANGNNPYDESPTEHEDYNDYLSSSIIIYHDFEMIPDETYDNIVEYAEAVAY